jgi:hypothetical protein
MRGELGDLLRAEHPVQDLASDGSSVFPDMRRARVHGTGRLPFSTVTGSSRWTLANPARSACRTGSRSSKSSMGSAPGGWMDS